VKRTEKCSNFDTNNKELLGLMAIHLVILKSYCNALEIIRLSAHIFTKSKSLLITLYNFQHMYTD